MKFKLFITFGIPVFLFSCQQATYIFPQKKLLIEAVYASGYTITANEHQVTTQVEGILRVMHVKPGDTVKKGDVLFEIAAEQQAARLSAARKAYDAAGKNVLESGPILGEMNLVLMSLKNKFLHDSINFVRFSELMAGNATSQAAYNQAELMYKSAKSDYLSGQKRYARLQEQVKVEFESALQQYNIALDEMNRYLIRSQIDGIVLKTEREKDEQVRRGEVLAVVGNTDQLYLRLQVDEQDAALVKHGQKIVVKLDAIPDAFFNATITGVNPMIDSRIQSVQVDAKFTEDLPVKFSSMAVEANIIIKEVADAMVIPKSTLVSPDSVRVKNGNHHIVKKVTIGITTMDEVQIVSGLSFDDQVIIN